MKKAAIFDVDGTLLDSVDLHARAWQEALKHFGHEVDFSRLRSQIGKGSDQFLPAFLSQQEIDQRGEEITEYRSELFKREYLSKVRPFPGVRELFEHLKAAGLELLLGSSSKGDELEKYKRILGIEDLVDSQTSSDDAKQSKPEPDIFEAALKRLDGIDKKLVTVIGDTPYDAEAAAKAGLKSIGFLCGGFPEKDLRAAGCVEVYEGPLDLLARFKSSALA